ncbi:calcium-binding protein [Croceibacterium mercuriale]|nr:calcium-binding protein [Croceibacterium mercuriale]
MFDTAAFIQAENEPVVVNGTTGDDTLNTGTNRTTLNGLVGNDTLTTGLLGRGYTGELYAIQNGGTGNDTMSVLINAFTNYAYTQLDGGTGADRLSVNSTLTNEDADATVLIENYLTGGTGDDVIDVDATLSSVSGGNINNEVYAGTGNDTVTMTARVLEGTDVELAYNYADGGTGDDTIFATAFGDGDDYLINEVSGGIGNDIIIARTEGGYGESYIAGGSGADVLQVIGGFYNELYGQGGNDTLFGGTGIDIMSGGTEADRFFIGLNNGADVITDFQVGSDTLVLTDGQTIDSLAISNGSTFVTFADGGSVLLQGVTIADEALLFG